MVLERTVEGREDATKKQSEADAKMISDDDGGGW